MAGRKVFTSGEILTAADVNSFLMDQSVMVFADDDARSSAIPTPSSGMVTFREDQDVVEVFDGSAFKTVGGLVAVKSALFTGVQTASVSSAGDNFPVTDLSITHEVSDPANRLIISAFCGALATQDGATFANFAGMAVNDGTGFIAVGDAVGSRTSIASGGRGSSGNNDSTVRSDAVTFVHSPGSGSKTYTVHVFSMRNGGTIFVNRSPNDGSDSSQVRTASSLVIQEVAV